MRQLMTYQYEFDDTELGYCEFPVESYRLLQEGLKELWVAVQEWNEKAKQQGAKTAPYEREAEQLQTRISYGEQKLKEGFSFVRINGMTVGSMRYLRAGLELSLRRRKSELAKNRAEGWPSAVLAKIGESISELERLAETLKVEPAEILWEVLPQDTSSEIVAQMRTENEELWDVFICHASEDKEDFVRPLAKGLQEHGLKVWYDEITLKIGDSLRRSIDRGLSRCRYGVVVLSPSFFAKEWPQKELDGLTAREISDKKVILPVWHKIDAEGVRRHSPTLADRVAASAEDGVEVVVQRLLKEIRR